MNFDQAQEMFKTARDLGEGKRRKLENNTYLYQLDDDTFGIMLHATYVVKIHRNGTFTLNSGGWQTPTTKDRINNYSPVRMWQHLGIWYIDKDEVFEDGCIVNSEGKRVDAGTKDAATVEKIKRKLDRMVKKYIDGFAECVVTKGGLEIPTAADCMGCSMKSADADKETPDFRGFRMERTDVKDTEVMGFDHLLSHMKEKYYVPSLLWKAIVDEGFPKPEMTWALIDADVKRGRTDMLKRVLRGYFRRRKPSLMNLLTA